MPVSEADYFGLSATSGSNPLVRQHFGLMLQALDDLKANEVYIATGASLRYALWGGLMSTRALKLRAAGAVLDGYSRDTHEILQLGFPTWSYGAYAQDQAPRGTPIGPRHHCRLQTGVTRVDRRRGIPTHAGHGRRRHPSRCSLSRRPWNERGATAVRREMRRALPPRCCHGE